MISLVLSVHQKIFINQSGWILKQHAYYQNWELNCCLRTLGKYISKIKSIQIICFLELNEFSQNFWHHRRCTRLNCWIELLFVVFNFSLLTSQKKRNIQEGDVKQQSHRNFLFENILLIWRRHQCPWRAAKLILRPYGLSSSELLT